MIGKFARFDRPSDAAGFVDTPKLIGGGAMALVLAMSVFATANTHIEGAVSCRKVKPAFLGDVACTGVFRGVAGALDIPFTPDHTGLHGSPPSLIVTLPRQR